MKTNNQEAETSFFPVEEFSGFSELYFELTTPSRYNTLLIGEGMEYLGRCMENGITSFTGWAEYAVNDLGMGIVPYLKAIYLGLFYYPGSNPADFDPILDIDAYDIKILPGSPPSLAFIDADRNRTTAEIRLPEFRTDKFIQGKIRELKTEITLKKKLTTELEKKILALTQTTQHVEKTLYNAKLEQLPVLFMPSDHSAEHMQEELKVHTKILKKIEDEIRFMEQELNKYSKHLQHHE